MITTLSHPSIGIPEMTIQDRSTHRPDETFLIQAAQKGSLEAFNDLVLIHQDRVYQVACRVLRDDLAAEDATQTAFLRAYQKVGSFYGGSFQAWLLKIVTHLCFDELRKQKRHPVSRIETESANPEDEPVLETLVANTTTPEQAVVQREQIQTIGRCIGALPDDLRLVIELVDIQGLGYAEAAQAIDCPMGTVKSRLARARQRLHETLRHEQIFP